VRVAGGKDTPGGWYEHAVTVDGVTIPYRYCRSRRRTLGMTVRPDKSVSVRVPLGTGHAAIREFVTRRGAWIARVWARCEAHSPMPVQSYATGAAFLYRGVHCLLALERDPCASVQLRDGRLVVTAPDDPSPAELRERIDAWYRARALEVFQERLAACHGRITPAGSALPLLTIRPMTSRWGSYSYRTRRITLNLNLIKLPPTCLDYVIIHELCHIHVRHHGPAFWRLVACHVPDYRALRRQLTAFIPVLH